MAECSGSVVSNNLINHKQSSVVQQSDATEDQKTDKVMEPLLIEDLKNSTVTPLVVQNLYKHLEQNNLLDDRTNVLAGLIYLLSAECGFIPIQFKDYFDNYDYNYQKVLFLSQNWPENWKRKSFFKFNLCLSGFDAIYTINIVKLTEDLVLNSTVVTEEGTACSQQLLLDPLTYFTSSGTDITIRRLQNLNHLSRLVKDQLLIPSKKHILQNNDQIYPSLEFLPYEIITKILSYLNGIDLCHTGATTKCLQTICNQPLLWKNLLKREFKVEDHFEFVLDMKNLYQRLRKRKQTRVKLLGFHIV